MQDSRLHANIIGRGRAPGGLIIDRGIHPYDRYRKPDVRHVEGTRSLLVYSTGREF